MRADPIARSVVLGVAALGLAATIARLGQADAHVAQVAVLFQPLGRRVQSVVDRRFDRARFDSDRAAAAFAERLRAEVDIDAVTGDLRTTVDRTLRPTRQTLWLRRAVG